jgi:hypothetical protein
MKKRQAYYMDTEKVVIANAQCELRSNVDVIVCYCVYRPVQYFGIAPYAWLTNARSR